MLGWAILVGAALATVAIGVLVHELLHALVLRTAGVECSITLVPDDGATGGFETLVSGALASVGIDSVPPNCPVWRLRLAAMAPLVMLIPVGVYAWFVTQGTLAGTQLGSIVVICWMACALPSPADFAIVWHTEDTQELIGDAT